MATFVFPPETQILQSIVQKKKIRAYLVGGFLRDLSVGRSGQDVDFAIDGDALALARVFAKKIRGTFVLLDAERKCARVVKKKPDGHWSFDLSELRAKDIKGDLKLRDFTINTLAVDLNTLDLASSLLRSALPNKAALLDLKSRTLRMVSVRSFKDDPLRLLRAYSLRAQLGFKIDPSTRRIIRSQVKLIRSVSPERIREELFKILATSRAADIFKEMERDGLLFVVIPQLRLMHKVHQGGYHHLDIWEHSLEVLRQVEGVFAEFAKTSEIKDYLDECVAGGHSRRTLIRFACLLHDLGKPETKKIEHDRTSFHGHEHVGRHLTRIIARELMLSTKERFALEDMVSLHLRPGYLSNFKNPSERMLFRFLRDAKQEAGATLFLSLADQRATRGPLTSAKDVAHHQKINLSALKAFFVKRAEKPFLRLIDGHDLIKILKLKPGPQFAKILLAVDEAQHLGRVTSKAEALALALKIA